MRSRIVTISIAALAAFGSTPPTFAEHSDPPPPVHTPRPGELQPPPQALDSRALDALKLALDKRDYTAITPFLNAGTAIEFGHHDPVGQQFVLESVAYGIDGFKDTLIALNEKMGKSANTNCSFQGSSPQMSAVCFKDYKNNMGRSAILIFGEGSHLIMSRVQYFSTKN